MSTQGCFEAQVEMEQRRFEVRCWKGKIQAKGNSIQGQRIGNYCSDHNDYHSERISQCAQLLRFKNTLHYVN